MLIRLHLSRRKLGGMGKFLISVSYVTHIFYKEEVTGYYTN